MAKRKRKGKKKYGARTGFASIDRASSRITKIGKKFGKRLGKIT